MYLKSIKAQGFKSFADKLDLEINPGITGIVGPNGSGKSNIVDAVRWVLGEQSVKSLRGENGMTDCIFTGSESRPAQKRAMVALTFDNTDHYLNSEFGEIEIKRVIYATGENEYFINNTKVRLKDIQDLFIDSGAGNGAFNIISQGNVADIVNSKSNDRRVIFESAAGVLKYKKRKEESLRKLDKTEENITRVRLVINELKETVEPLEEQSAVAKRYLTIKEELEGIDIALITRDITEYNLKYKSLGEETESIKDKLATCNNMAEDAEIEKLKLKSIEYDEALQVKRDEQLKLSEELSNLNSEKKLTLERQKYKVDKKQIDENLIKLKEQELECQKEKDIATNEVENIESSIGEEKAKLDDIQNKVLVEKVKKSNSFAALQDAEKNKFLIQNKITILENNILSSESAPVSVKNILNNPRLKGIHNTIGKLIDIPDEYMVACDVALGASSNYIVVDNDSDALKAIDFLKERKLGRATFYPISVIKSRYIANETLQSIKNIKGFVGILSDLVSYDSIYKNIIENQLGQVIVVDNSNTLQSIGKLIDYRYRIVSLDGDIIHVGGSITGGTSKKTSMLNEKNELNKLKEELNSTTIKLDSLNNELEVITNNLNELEEKEMVTNKYIVLLNQELLTKRNTLDKVEERYKEITSELNGINNIKENNLDEELVKLMESIKETEKQKELVELDIKSITNDKNDILDQISILLRKQKEANLLYNNLNEELRNKEIEAGKLEVKLDNLLSNLNSEYNLTYENAIENYTLDMDPDIARSRVNKLKRELNSLGNVNLGAIEEYDRLKTRYDFLTHQESDLTASSEELKGIIAEMDEIMERKFSDSFKKISKEFTQVFKLMFKGGHGELKLCNEDDLLNTGVDIIAIPPGKKISSPVALSGGEKALTAICLLFAMLQVKPSPFVILDEAEAALDEVNVDMFGKYLNTEKNRSQFIVITHKKRMMEYADALYGITMQESGVSKIVSARLENN